MKTISSYLQIIINNYNAVAIFFRSLSFKIIIKSKKISIFVSNLNNILTIA